MAERDLQLAAVFQIETGQAQTEAFLNVAQIVGTSRPLTTNYRVSRAAHEVAQVRDRRGMHHWSPTAIFGEMSNPNDGTYLLAYRRPDMEQVLFDQQGFCGYVLREAMAADEPITFREAAVVKGLTEQEERIVLSGLFAAALDHPAVRPESAAQLLSRAPSANGSRVMAGLGFQHDYLARPPRFVGNVGALLGNLGFLGYNLRDPNPKRK
ncbi:MAG TPA: hypothetical protein VF466_04750 [Candidatus Saccharimonadales bacterium]